MISKYEVGDTVLLRATIESIEALSNDKILYKVNEIELPVLEEDIVARIEEPWKLLKLKTE